MSGNASTGYSGIGFCGLLAVALIVLKLTRVLAWPWVWILAPLWVPPALVGALVLVVLVFAVALQWGEKKKKEKLAEAARASMCLPFEKDVPLPPPREGAEKIVPELAAMKAGESILIPNLPGKEHPPLLASTVGLYGLEAGKHFEMQYQAEGLRVWRTK